MPVNQPRDDSGASAVEYGLLVAAIAGVIVLIIFALGAFTGELFNDTCDSMDAASAIASATDCP